MKKLLLMCFMLVIAFTMVGCNNETEKVKLYYSNSNMNKSLKIVSDTNSDNTIKIPELVENDTNSDKTIKIPELVADSNNIVNNRLIIYIKSNDNIIKNLHDDFATIGLELEKIEWLNESLYKNENNNEFIMILCITFKNIDAIHISKIKDKVKLLDCIIDVYEVLIYEIPNIDFIETEKISLK
ncbi:MAG: hypothetical protein SOY54_03745 [Bacilli bacterium]|nr:hypothetical protein [Bacilli bacterium]